MRRKREAHGIGHLPVPSQEAHLRSHGLTSEQLAPMMLVQRVAAHDRAHGGTFRRPAVGPDDLFVLDHARKEDYRR